MNMKLELMCIPVTDVDRAKAFYERVGFHADHDHRVNDELRFVQLTPPGSACSICIGQGLTKMQPGSIDMIVLVVSDVHQARQTLIEQGIEVNEVEKLAWGSFIYFADPDGNRWSLQQLPPR